MCGICGMVGGGGRELLLKMCDTLRHRGPDSQGQYSMGSVHLGMTRLSIIDLPGGNQPIFNEDNTLLITFNGEIYNYRELRKGLLERGHRFTTQADTEVILHLYEENGDQCLEQLTGMFALAIWNIKEQELFLARDRLGVKPLFLLEKGGFLAWASELKALKPLEQFSYEMSQSALHMYLQFLYIPSPHTIYRCCTKLKAGHWLKWKHGKTTMHEYWRPTGRTTPNLSVDEAVQQVRTKLRQAVSRRLVADVPVGAFLSGGVDSASVVALMSQASSKPIQTFTIGYGKQYASYNEWEKARLVARTFGTDHHEFVVEPQIHKFIFQIVEGFDEPFADSSAIPTYLVSRETSRQVKVALSGVAGDEMFCGYPRYVGAWLWLHYQKLPRALRRILSGASWVFKQSPTATNYGGRIRRFLQTGSEDEYSRYLSWISFGNTVLQSRLLQKPAADNADHEHGRIWEACPYMDYLRKIQYLDIFSYLTDDLLCIGDRMSMAHSLELREPFCDHELVEFSLSLDPQLKMRNFNLKWLLKKAMQGILPQELLKARKQGFMIPLANWLLNDLAPLTQELLAPVLLKKQGFFHAKEVQSLIARFRSREFHLAHLVWALIVFQIWLRNR